jgi:ABC-type transport system involved in cytochrome c biogenesis permease component
MAMAQQTIIWAAICLVALGLALWRPAAGRLVLGLFFITVAVGVEAVFVLASPDGSLDLDTTAPLLSPWWVLERVVARAPATFSLLVASYGVAIGLMMVKGGRWGSLGLAGGIVLLLIVAPLCPWTVPGLILAAALGVILLRDPRSPSSLPGVESGPPDARRRVPLGNDRAKKGAPAS